MEKLKEALEIIDLEIYGLHHLKSCIDTSLLSAIQTFKTSEKIIITGIGKSGHIAKKISSTFSSLGIPSMFIHSSEASHGDMGNISQKDCVLAISKSGNTKELNDIVHYCNVNNITLVSMSENRNSLLGEKSNIFLHLPKTNEACFINLAPTTSTTVSLVFGDVLAILTSQEINITKEKFGKYHPGGKLGTKLMSVEKIMNKEIPLVEKGSELKQAILEFSSKRMGCVGITENKKLIGIITDGDLRRNLSDNIFQKNVEEMMTLNPYTINKDVSLEHALEKMQNNEITCLFILDNENIVGCIHIHDLLKYI